MDTTADSQKSPDLPDEVHKHSLHLSCYFITFKERALEQLDAANPFLDMEKSFDPHDKGRFLLLVCCPVEKNLVWKIFFTYVPFKPFIDFNQRRTDYQKVIKFSWLL